MSAITMMRAAGITNSNSKPDMSRFMSSHSFIIVAINFFHAHVLFCYSLTVWPVKWRNTSSSLLQQLYFQSAFWRTAYYKFAFIYDHYLIAYLLCLVHKVRGVENGFALLPVLIEETQYHGP